MDGAEFVVLPLWVVMRDDIPDSDIRVLLALDHMGWREGGRDGVITAPTASIADRLKRSVWSVNRSIHRLCSVEPCIVTCEMAGNRRGPIVLQYDRLGRGRTHKSRVQNCTEDDAPVVQICTESPPVVQNCTETHKPSVQNCTAVVQNCTDIPIKSEREEEAADERGPRRPETLEELQDWVAEFIDENQDVGMKVRGWVASYGVSDTFDALSKAWARKPDSVAPYVNATLLNWHAKGQLPSKQPRALPPAHAGPAGAAAPAARPTKAQRNSETYAARRASAARHFASKEPADEPR